MREIKFRGRDGDDWYYGSLFVNECGHTVISAPKSFWMKPVNADTVGQYTGLKDCKGREIYEGDVVEFNDSWHDINGNYCEKMQRGYIKYDYGEFSIVTLCGEAFLRLLSTCVQSDTLIVIGNVYDNPELLEVEA